MNSRRDLFTASIAALGAVGLLLILAPVAYLMFSSSPSTLWEALTEPEVLASLGLTFACGLAATAMGLVLGTPLAYLLARREFAGKKLVLGIIDIPVVIPHPVAGIALLLVFSGLPREASPVGNWKGIVLAMFFVSASLLVHSALEGFRAIPEQMEWTSRSLGLGRAGTFFRLALPLNARGLLAGSILMWARSISEFGSIVILVYNPRVASVLIYDRFTSYGLAEALPVAVILVWISVGLFFAMRKLQERRGVWRA